MTETKEKFKMDPAKKGAWVEALRSGKYKQGKGKLKQRDEEGTYYCCLGVLREITEGVSDDEGSYLFLKGDIAEKCGIEDKSVGVGVQSKLARMNDGCTVDNTEPKSFPEIADWIEENL